MDSGLKERLVGAAVLVVLGVWLIPWLLNGPDPQPPVAAGDEPLSLPAASTGGAAPTRTETIVLADASRQRAPAGEADIASRVAAEPDTGSAPTADRTAADGGGDASPPPAQGTTAGERGPGASATKPATATAATAAISAAPQSGSGWVVQMGSFGDESNASRLSERISAFGYSAAVTPYRSGGRTLHRVRVGPWESREEAEAVASSLGAHGFVAQVVGAD